MPFWSKQPVFHLYNLSYWICGTPGIINYSLPLINKYVDLFNINTFSLSDNSTKDKQIDICKFIKENYIYLNDKKNNEIIYHPNKNNIIDYLIHSNHNSYFTVYNENTSILSDTKTNNIIAVISARPLYVRLNTKTLFKSDKKMFVTYYVDNLCVKPEYRKKGIAANMIQTHYYNIRHHNKLINTCLFKREGELNSIVPLISFKTYCIQLNELCNNNITFPHHTLIEIGLTQLHLFIDFIKSQINVFNCVILPDVTNIMHLIKTKNLFVYCLINETNNIISCYIFRLIELSYDGQKTCECISSIAACSIDLFQNGFKQACELLKTQLSINLVLLEETAHSYKLMTSTMRSITKFISPTAFFFYNYACYSIKNSKFLIIY